MRRAGRERGEPCCSAATLSAAPVLLVASPVQPVANGRSGRRTGESVASKDASNHGRFNLLPMKTILETRAAPAAHLPTCGNQRSQIHQAHFEMDRLDQVACGGTFSFSITSETAWKASFSSEPWTASTALHRYSRPTSDGLAFATLRTCRRQDQRSINLAFAALRTCRCAAG